MYYKAGTLCRCSQSKPPQKMPAMFHIFHTMIWFSKILYSLPQCLDVLFCPACKLWQRVAKTKHPKIRTSFPHEPRFSLKIQGFPVSLFLFSFYLGQLGQVKSKIHIKVNNIKINSFELPRLPHLTSRERKIRINTGFFQCGRHICRGSDGAALLP